LTDFGLSKALGESERTTTMCGTPGYLAPEILSGQPYTTAVDYWSLGVFMFEITSGLNPFLADSTHKTLQNILHKAVIYPESMFSKEARSFMQLLLVRDPTKRLCDPDAMKRHPYFKGIDWHQLLVKKIKSPYKIQLTSDADTSNFDSAFTRQAVSVDLSSNADDSPPSSTNSATDESFAGFDYVSPDANLL
jgi:serine/threonine protein kinase